MAKTKYEIIEVNNIEVTVDLSMLLNSNDMFFNATEIAKQFDKRPHDFLRDSKNAEYLSSLVTHLKCNDNDLVITKKGGKYQGTWYHQKLALQFARWISSDFAVKLDAWVIGKLKEEDRRRKDRLASKTGYLELSEAVQNAHDPDKHYHYSNEANMINKIVLDMTAKEFKEKHKIESLRDHLDAFQISSISKLQRMNTSLIDLDVDYQERKDKLTAFYQGKILIPE